MKKNNLQKYIGTEKLSIVEAMRKIDINSAGLIYIVDDNNELIGCLTDGDIRRWIIKTGNLHGIVSQMMNKNPKFLFEAEISKSEKYMQDKQIRSVAIINTERKIVNIIFRKGHIVPAIEGECLALQDIPVIIMAGGKGTRLYPFTKILPKPLIPIGDVPILERILNRFYKFGANEFFITLNYKKGMIKSYFAEIDPPYKLHYIEENLPLGTAGSIRLIKKVFTSPVVITNCDILIEADYKKIVEYHVKSSNDMTIVSSLKNTVIPYGVLHSGEQGIITSIEEKPQLSYFINTGMYIINPEQLELIPPNKVFHMTELAEKMMKEGKKVGMYPISENSFLDMGEFEEMKKMEERINSEITD